jgi:hypothetical protein
MPKQPHWFDPYHASEFFGSLLEAAIEVTKTTKKAEPPKPKPPQKKEPKTR